MRRLNTTGLMAVAAVVVSVIFLSGNAPARRANSETTPPHAQRFARTISTYEMMRHHVELWDESADVRALVTEMCDAMTQSSDVGVTWTSHHFGLDASRAGQKPTEFEVDSMRRLQTPANGPREVWSDDHTRYVRAVLATHANCSRCHVKPSGEDSLIGFVSLEFSEPLWP
jgi:hypothetical protein